MTRLRSLLLFLALLVSGCAGPTYVVEHYPGPQKSAEDIAVLRFRGADDAKLVTVDGERADIPIDEDARLHIEVLPGEHRLGVVSASALQGPLQMVSFAAVAQKTYAVAFTPQGARVYEIDPDSDARLRDVTLPPARPSAPAIPAPAPAPVVEEVPVAPAKGSRDAAREWMNAMMQDRLDTAMALTGMPFSWDRRDLISSRDELRMKIAEVMRDKDHSQLTLGTEELVTLDAAELSQRYRGSDPVEVVRFPVKGDESVLVFVRSADGKVVGFTD